MVTIKNADVAKFGSSRNSIRQTTNRIIDTAWFKIVAVPVLVDFRISRNSKVIESSINASAPDSCQTTPEIIVRSRTDALSVTANGARPDAFAAAALAAAEPPVKAIKL